MAEPKPTANNLDQPVPRPAPRIVTPNHMRPASERISVRRPELDFQGPKQNH